MAKRATAKDRPTSRTLSVKPREAAPNANAALEVTQTWEQGFRDHAVVRTLRPGPSGMSEEDYLDDFSEVAVSDRPRSDRALPIPIPYWKGENGEAFEGPYHDERLDFRLSTADRRFLLAIVEEQWLPLVWRQYEVAGLPAGHWVWIQTPTGEWKPEIASLERPEGHECPAWRLPWAHRFARGDAPWLAGELLLVACALAEELNPNAPRLRRRFTKLDEDDAVRPIDVAILAFEGARLHAALSLHEPWPRHATRKTPVEAAEAGLNSQTTNLGRRASWKLPAAERLQQAIEKGAAFTASGLARLLEGFPGASREHKYRTRAVAQMMKDALIKPRDRDNTPQPPDRIRGLPSRS